jgi:hypothetical protein
MMQHRISERRPGAAVTNKAGTPKIIGPADLGKMVIQRAGEKDCVIASVATGLQLTYENVAAMFEVELSDDGSPQVGNGIDFLDTIGALFSHGYVACPLISSEHSAAQDAKIKHLSSSEIKDAIKGHVAIIGYTDADPTVRPHALVWDGSKTIDCSNATIVGLEDVTVDIALVLTRAIPFLS